MIVQQVLVMGCDTQLLMQFYRSRTQCFTMFLTPILCRGRKCGHYHPLPNGLVVQSLRLFGLNQMTGVDVGHGCGGPTDRLLVGPPKPQVLRPVLTTASLRPDPFGPVRTGKNMGRLTPCSELRRGRGEMGCGND